jgi:hypothetical protein
MDKFRERIFRTLKQTPGILQGMLHEVSPARAQEARDGADGWNVLEIVCHMRDFEAIFLDRVKRVAETDHPTLEHHDHEAMVTTNRYAEQSVEAAFADYLTTRRALVAYLEGMDAAAWQRRGEHPTMGAISMVEVVLNVPIHDINHIEQIARALGQTERLL